MLADVIKQLQEEKQKLIQADIDKYNKPYKRDTIIYFDNIYILGGIQTWITNLGLKYDFSVVYDTGHPDRIKYLNDLGIETIKYVGQEIECNTLIFPLFGNPDKIKAKKRILVIHGDYKVLQVEEIPTHDEVYAVSKTAANSWEEVAKEKCGVLYNPVEIVETIKPLIIGVFSRLSSEKGKGRIKTLIEQLKASNKPFLMLIFTDLPFEEEDKRVIFMNPLMNPSGWMQKCDYICQLSDTEAGCLTAQESLKMGIPLIITRLPILDEFGINETNSKILEFDMSNLDINDLWNIPQVKWQEPISKEWDSIMKKRVFRKRNEEPKKEVKIEKEETKEEPKKKSTKKVK